MQNARLLFRTQQIFATKESEKLQNACDRSEEVGDVRDDKTTRLSAREAVITMKSLRRRANKKNW
jgi:hypothetical protein